jgi:hypothetical protein
VLNSPRMSAAPIRAPLQCSAYANAEPDLLGPR